MTEETKTPTLRVRALRDRYGFDGQTGIVVCKGTEGTVSDLQLKPPLTSRPGAEPFPQLTVFWDVAAIQDTSNKDFALTENWEETDIEPKDVEVVR